MEYYIKTVVNGEEIVVTKVEEGFTVMWEAEKKAKTFIDRRTAEQVADYLQKTGHTAEICVSYNNAVPENPRFEGGPLEAAEHKRVFVIYDCDQWKTRSSRYIVAVCDEAHLNDVMATVKKNHGYTDEELETYLYIDVMNLNEVNGGVYYV